MEIVARHQVQQQWLQVKLQTQHAAGRLSKKLLHISDSTDWTECKRNEVKSAFDMILVLRIYTVSNRHQKICDIFHPSAGKTKVLFTKGHRQLAYVQGN